MSAVDCALEEIRIPDFRLCPAARARVFVSNRWRHGDLSGPYLRTGRNRGPKLVIWNASSSHKRALGPSGGERLWRMQVCEAGRSRRWC
jgi:hypothetical protein